MTGLAALLAEASEAWDPIVESAIFGTTDPWRIEEVLLAFVEHQLGRVTEAMFYRPGVGVVVGLRLVDGSEVVVKVHRWNVTISRLAAVQSVQRQLATAGLPVPEPLVGPNVLGGGIATVETLLPGLSADGHDPEIRRLLASGLGAIIAADVAVESAQDLGRPLMLRPPGAPLWFEPHDLRFDFEATADGAEWIDELAEKARRGLDEYETFPLVVGHFDWRVQNLGFVSGEITGIYDWDSLAVAPEAVVVGNAAAVFSADWSGGDIDPLPTLTEMRNFVADYEQASQRSFDGRERKLLDAANLYACAYGARCQRSDMKLYPKIRHGPTTAWIRLLQERVHQTL